MIFNKLDVTVLIMCQNEELNIKHALNSVVPYFSQVIVTDSFSTDGTVQIINEFSSVEFYRNKFTDWASQRNWMLDNCAIKNKIVFFLDADESVNLDFIRELNNILKSGLNFDSIQMKADMYFLGRHLKYSYGHPIVKRIFVKNKVRFYGVGAREYSTSENNILTMKNTLIHYDRRGLSYWIDKHNSNSTRECLSYINGASDSANTNLAGLQGSLKYFLRIHIWENIPLLVRPFVYFIYRYIFKFGFLDGLPGFIFCFLHSLWYRFLIDAKIVESKNKFNDIK